MFERLDIVVTHREGGLVFLCTSLADEDAERNREVGCFVSLAVDAELVVRVLAQVALDLGCHAFRLWHQEGHIGRELGTVAMGLDGLSLHYCSDRLCCLHH